MYRGLISLMPKAKPLLLDLYPNAAVAYSLRKLRTAYTGSAIRVRRSSDNTEQDIGFDNSGDLDVNSIENFVGWNLSNWSEDLTQSAWNKIEVTVNSNAIVSPDGLTTGDVLFETTANSNHRVIKDVAGKTGQPYTVSFYAKAQGRNFIRLTASSGLNSRIAFVNLTTGTIHSQPTPFINLTVTPVGNSWYLISFTEIAANTSIQLSINLSTNGSLVSYPGDTALGVSIWGYQVTESSTLKTYRQTLDIAEGQGFVTTWYDQSTNANNSTQATATLQAQVVLNGNLILDVDTNKITTTWAVDSYLLTSGINPNTQYLSVSATRRETTSGLLIQLGVSTAIGGVNGQAPLFWTGTGNLRSYMPTLVTHNNIATADGYIVTSEKNASDLKTMYLNGSAQPTTATEAPASGTNINTFGRVATNHTTGQYQEYIYWNSDQSANRTGIETNINNYWTIY